jgi:hypothetical protein
MGSCANLNLKEVAYVRLDVARIRPVCKDLVSVTMAITVKRVICPA